MSLPDHPQYGLSHSRDRMLAECERRYYLHYYVSWGGWTHGADESATAAYRNKKLTSLPALLGTQMHERAREIALAIHAGRDIPCLDELVQRTRDEMNTVWRLSRDREAFVRCPSRHPMAMERYYDLQVSSEQLAAMAGRMRTLLSSLHAWPGWDEVAQAEADSIRLFDALDHAEFEGVALYAPPDLVYGPPGAMTIIDWKTGRDPSPDDTHQIALYHLYLHLRGFSAADEPVTGRIVYLGSQEEQVVALDGQSLEQARRRMRDSMLRSRRLLVDMDELRNEPLAAEHFPPRHDERRCRWCPMQEACAIGRPATIGPF
jgi:hypothetical protein